MNAFEKMVKHLVRYFYHIAGWAIVIMMLLTCVDVVLRLAVTLHTRLGWAILRPFRPIPGTYELVCFLGLIAAAFAMAHTSVEEGHVSVNFFTRLLPKRGQAGFEVGTGLLSLFFFGIIAWRSYEYAIKVKEWNEVSMTLRLPYYPFAYGIAFSALTVSLVLVIAISNNWIKVIKK
jgi:TRAP-type C4-dicarboxylate transport system permease small subunit